MLLDLDTSYSSLDDILTGPATWVAAQGRRTAWLGKKWRGYGKPLGDAVDSLNLLKTDFLTESVKMYIQEMFPEDFPNSVQLIEYYSQDGMKKAGEDNRLAVNGFVLVNLTSTRVATFYEKGGVGQYQVTLTPSTVLLVPRPFSSWELEIPGSRASVVVFRLF